MKQPIYLLIGVPGSGKSWVASHIGHKLEYVSHDKLMGQGNHSEAYLKEILKVWETATKPLLVEAPFSVSQIKDPLEKAGAEVKPVIIGEDKGKLSERYKNDPSRDGKDIPKGHLTRMDTYLSRADEYKAFVGTSSEVLDYLLKQTSIGDAVARRAQALGD